MIIKEKAKLAWFCTETKSIMHEPVMHLLLPLVATGQYYERIVLEKNAKLFDKATGAKFAELSNYINRNNPCSFTEFLAAVSSGDVKKLADLNICQEYLTFTSKQYDGSTALGIAAQQGHLKIVEYLIANGASLTQVDYNGFLAIHHAAKNCQFEILQFMLTQDKNLASVRIQSTYGQTLLHLAAKAGDQRTISYLINSDFLDVDVKDKSKEATPLDYAISADAEDTVKFLLSMGAKNSAARIQYAVCQNFKCAKLFMTEENKKLILETGPILLEVSAYSNNLEVTKYIHEMIFSLNDCFVAGHDPIHEAASGGSLEVLEYFKSKDKESLNRRSKNGFIPLHKAKTIAVAKLLLDNGADPLDDSNEKHLSPIKWAEKESNWEVANFLKKHIEVNYSEEQKTNILLDEIKKNQEEMLEIVKKRMADLENKLEKLEEELKKESRDICSLVMQSHQSEERFMEKQEQECNKLNEKIEKIDQSLSFFAKNNVDEKLTLKKSDQNNATPTLLQ